MTFKHNTVLDVTASLFVGTTLADVKIGLIGSLNSDIGLSTLRGAEIAIEEINAAGGVSGKELVLASADIGEDVTEGVEVYEHLAETEEADFIISGPIDDVSLGWLPHTQEFQVPMLDIWTSYIGIIDMVIEDLETMASCSVSITSDGALVTLYTNFGADMLKEEMGWDSAVILAEDATFGEAIIGLVIEALDPVAGIGTKEIITYDVGTVDFAPLFSKMWASGANFIYQVNSVNLQAIFSQYMKLQMPMVMIGMNVSALDLGYWEDTGSAGGGVSILSSIPSVGFKLDPESQKFIDTYRTRYDNRPKMPRFNGFNTHWGLKRAVTAAEATGGFGDAKAWSAGMEGQDIMLKRNSKMWLRYTFWGDDEVEKVTGWAYPHNVRSDLMASYDNAQPSMVIIQWEEDGEVDVVYPPEYTTTEFTVPSWVR